MTKLENIEEHDPDDIVFRKGSQATAAIDAVGPIVSRQEVFAFRDRNRIHRFAHIGILDIGLVDPFPVEIDVAILDFDSVSAFRNDTFYDDAKLVVSC